MPSEFTQRRQIEFHETDMAGIVHFSNYFRFMEEVEHAFFRSIGSSVHGEDDAGNMFGFVRVNAQCDYRAPLRYQQVLEIRLRISHISNKSITYIHDFHPVDADGHVDQATLLARGTITVVYVTKGPHDSKMTSMPLPHDLLQHLETTTIEAAE